MIAETETESSWIFRWQAHGGQHALAFLHEKPEWVKRFRVPPGGWTNDEPIDLELPINQEMARRIARDYILANGGSLT